jgi:hypothetical protein
MRSAISFVTNRGDHTIVVVLLSWLLTQGCTTSLIRNRTIYQSSPDKQTKLIVATVGIKPQLRVFLENRGASSTVFSDGGEWLIRFVQIYWSPDSKICGVYVLGWSSAVTLAFDAKSGSQIDPAFVRDKIKSGIIEKYKLQSRAKMEPSFDAFAWTGTREAESAFQEAKTEAMPATR